MRGVQPSRRSSWRRGASMIGVTLVVTALCALGLGLGALSGFQRSSLDALFPSAVADDRVVVVGIDRQALQAQGLPWPWPRTVQAELIEAIGAAGAAVIVVDFSYPTAGSDDDRLAEALGGSASVLAVATGVGEAVAGGPPRAESAAEPHADLAAASLPGHAATYVHPADGVVRSLPLLVERSDRTLLPSLSLAALMQLEGAPDTPTLRPNGVQIGDRFIPTENDYELRLNFTDALGVDGPAFYSAQELLGGTIPERAFVGKVVLIGATDPTLGDVAATPLAKGDDAAGVLVHAQALNTMLTSAYLKPVGDGTTLFSASVLALLVAAAVLLLPLGAASAATVLLAGVNLAHTFWQFDGGVVYDLVYPSLAIVLAFVLALAAKYWTETRERRRVTLLFGRFVPERVVSQLIDAGRAERSEGERLEATVFFCDLRGFTAFSERTEPAVVRRMLEIYYDEIVRAIIEHDGTVLQFVGDEVFAIWGAPLPQDDQRRRALDAALDAQSGWTRIAERLRDHGTAPLQYGIGLNSGPVVAGHVGGGDRLQYTVIGDTVNVGARLCSIAGPGEIVVSEDVLGDAPERPDAQPVRDAALKGVTRERGFWRIVAPSSQRLDDRSDPQDPAPVAGHREV